MTGALRPGPAWLAAFVIAACAGCYGEAPVGEPGADAAGGSDATRGDDAPEHAGPPAPEARRLAVDQLQRSIEVVTGGIRWTEDFGDGVDRRVLDMLSDTLAEPDYLRRTEEPREPSLVYAKLVRDMAHRVCARWVDRDRERPPDERTLIAHDDWSSLDDADVDRSLRHLRLRVLADHVPEDDDAAIAPLRELFHAAADAAPAARAAADGWYAVCIALMTDPTFATH